MLTLNDGRSELWQWDTGRALAVDADCSQVHFSNKVFGRSIDVDVVGGVAIIPDVLLQTDNDLNVWAFVGTAENGYTKISKTFKVNRRNKPADYVFTPTDQMTLQTIQSQIGDLADLTTEAKDTLVAAINEAARTGGGGGGSTVELDTTLTQSGKAADAKAVGDRISSLSEEKVNRSALSLGFGTDGKLYIMVSGVAIGDGVEINGSIKPSDGVVVFAADFSGLAPSADQFYSWEGRIYDNAIYDALQNIKCTDGVAVLTSVYDSANSRWIQQMMCTGGIFEADNFTCKFRAKFSGLAGSWNNVVTYGTGTHWTNSLYSDGVKWPAGGEIDAFEQAGGYADVPNTMTTPTAHYGSGTESGYPNTHEAKRGNTVEFTTDEWHDFKFSLNSGYVKVWIDDVLVGENDFSDCIVSNNYMADYAPFLKPQAFYIDGFCASGASAIDTSNVYKLEVSDFKIIQDAYVECTGLEIYPQMWPQGTKLIFPVGAELYLDRVYTPENTSNKACTWVSSNPTVATVVQGHVNVIGIGTATITAKCGNATAQYVLTSAENSNIPCAKLSLTQTEISLVSGDTYDLSDILYKYPNFTTESVSFTTGSETVEVSDAGIVTAIKGGNGTISVSCGVNTLEVSITVSAPNTPLIDNTFDNVDKAIGAVSDTLTGGFTAGQTYTAIWVLMPNPNYKSGTRAFSSQFYNNKAPGIRVDGGTLKLLGRSYISYDIDLGTAADGVEIRAVFTVGGITKFYVDGELKYTTTSDVASNYYPVGTDTWFSNQAINDQQYTLRRAALYVGEYLGTF